MGALMIRCPNTGYAIPTGYEADPARFREMPVFFAVSYCPICRLDHQWFAADAWVREQAAERGSLAQQKYSGTDRAGHTERSGDGCLREQRER